MGKTSYKGLRIDYKPNQKVKVMLGHDWFDAEVVKSNKKTVVVRTLFSKTKYRKVYDEEQYSRLEPYVVTGTRVVKLPRIKVKPIERHAGMKEVHEKNYGPEPSPTPAPQETVDEEVPTSGPGREELASRHLQQYESGEEPEMVEEVPAPEPEYEGPGLGKNEAPLVDYETGPTSEIPMIAEQAEEMLSHVDEPKAEPKPETAADVLAELEKLIA